MTNEQINAAIAKACGWTQIHVEDFSEMGIPCFMTMGVPPKFIHSENSVALPNYCTDLNWMHEAEKTLKYKQYQNYVMELLDFLDEPVLASARQRAEAFLRTLGKWEETTL